MAAALLGLVLAAGTAGRAQAQPGPTAMPEDLLPGLREILRGAVSASPTMITQRLYLVQAEAGRIGGNAGLYPNATASANYGRNSASSSGGDSSTNNTGLSYNVGASQPVFQWGALVDHAKVGQIGVRIAEKNYAEAYRLLVSSVRAQYLALIQKKLGVQSYAGSYRVAEKALATLQQALKEGSVAASELILPQIAVLDTRLGLDRVTADYDSARRQFARLVGLPDFADSQVPAAIPRPVYSEAGSAALLQNFLAAGPGVTNQGRIYVMSAEQAELNYKVARTGLLPKFGFSANYNLSYNNSVVGGSVNQSALRSYNVGLSGNWTIFDGFATRAAKLSALASRRSAERQIKSFAEATIDTVEGMHQQLGFAARGLELAERKREMAESTVKALQEAVTLGTATPASVESAQASAFNARLVSLYARSAYLLAYADFVSLAATDPALENLPAHYARTLP